MWCKTYDRASPLNTLMTKCIKQYCSRSDYTADHCLPIHVRQEMLDYVVRERVKVSADFVCNLLTGGVYSFDFWSLSEINSFNVKDVCDILDTLSENTATLKELILGGSTWIYNSRVIKGPLRKLFLRGRKFSKLGSLTMQQVSSADEFLSICESCDNLRKLEICQPSLTDRDISAIESELRKCVSIRKHLRQLRLPSTLKQGSGIMKLLAMFTNLQNLECARFESVLDLLDEYDTMLMDSNQISYQQLAFQTLSKLRGLKVTHPMSEDTIQRIVATCTILEEVSFEVQDRMQLGSLTDLKYLKRLELHNSPSFPASFLEQVLPILQQKGAQLESLSLEQFDVIDLVNCAKYCPNLETFSAQWFTILGYNNSARNGKPIVAKPFSNLRQFRLRPRSQRNVPKDAVDLLLSESPHIVHAELYCCYDLSDADVKRIGVKNSMKNLRSLILRHGHNVTKEALLTLMSKSKNLIYVDWGRPPVKKGDQGNDDEPGPQ